MIMPVKVIGSRRPRRWQVAASLFDFCSFLVPFANSDSAQESTNNVQQEMSATCFIGGIKLKEKRVSNMEEVTVGKKFKRDT